jgi:hypothetical protein
MKEAGALSILGRHETLVNSMLPGLWGYIEGKLADSVRMHFESFSDAARRAPWKHGKARMCQDCDSMLLGGLL